MARQNCFNYTADVLSTVSRESGAEFERTFFFLSLSLFWIFLFASVCFCKSCKKCNGESRCSWLLLRKTQRQIKASNLGLNEEVQNFWSLHFQRSSYFLIKYICFWAWIRLINKFILIMNKVSDFYWEHLF